MKLFTWKIARNVDACVLACAHLARLGPCVAAFQEPPEIDDDKIRLWSSGKLKLLTSDVPTPSTKDPQQRIHSSLVLLASDDITIDPVGVYHQYNPLLDKSRRLEGVSLVSRSGTRFQLLGAHELDAGTHQTAEERELSSTLLRRVVDDLWAGGPLICLGAWHCLDQIIVSPDLEPYLGARELLTSLMDASLVKTPLITEQGLPNKELYSNHLPVQMAIDIDKVRR